MHADILRGRLIELIHLRDLNKISEEIFMKRLRELINELES